MTGVIARKYTMPIVTSVVRSARSLAEAQSSRAGRVRAAWDSPATNSAAQTPPNADPP